jgi:uncharacterized protein YmfQ (DUF2313 family)
MLHKDILRALFPAKLGGVFDQDLETEAGHLDSAAQTAAKIINEMFADSTIYRLTDWERVYGLRPSGSLQARRTRLIAKIRERGGLSRAYFIGLAAAMGYTITIDELLPFQTGVNSSGDPIYINEVRFIWRVNVADSNVFLFRTGDSCSGERLSWWRSQTPLEDLLEELKPAHTFVIFNYS